MVALVDSNGRPGLAHGFCDCQFLSLEEEEWLQLFFFLGSGQRFPPACPCWGQLLETEF